MTLPTTPTPSAGQPTAAPQGQPWTPPQAPAAGPPPAQPIGLYSDAREAVKALNDGYSYWTGKLTEASFALSLAVIGANWAAFGSVGKIRGNWLSEVSIGLVMLNLAISLIGSEWLGELLRERIAYAEEDHPRWQDEFNQNVGQATPWPFTSKIDNVAKFFRYARVSLPLIGGVFFGFALFAGPQTQANQSQANVSASPTPLLAPAPDVIGQVSTLTLTPSNTPASTTTPASSSTPSSTPTTSATPALKATPMPTEHQPKRRHRK